MVETQKTEQTALTENLLLALGNPLLDILATTDKSFLEKYGLEANGAILADEKHMPMYEELTDMDNVEYIAGGSSENTVRALQWILGKPNVATYMGCIGKDRFGHVLESKAKGDGVDVKYMYHDSVPTGTCAVLITNHNRSLCANLSAAKHLNADHLKNGDNWKYVEKAQFYYSTSFVLNVTSASVMLLAKHAAKNNKSFALNLSAPYLISLHKPEMLEVLPFTDILFGNETEAAHFAKEHNFDTTDVEKIAVKLSSYLKQSNPARLVVITQGTDPVIVVRGNEVLKFDVPKVPAEKIVDTNAAGDAFAGGFLAMFIQKKPLETCVKCGIYAAQDVICQSGCSFPSKPTFTA